MDAILREHPHLAGCAVHCRRCGIRFLTHPRNAGREDLYCEFGCRELHRRELANARSQKHYQTAQGWRNKKLLNGKRSAATAEGKQEASPAGDPAAQMAPEEPPDENVQLTLGNFTLNEVILVNSPLWPYLAMVASLLEGRKIRPKVLLNTLRTVMRQRSFDRLPRREYVLRFLAQHPP